MNYKLVLIISFAFFIFSGNNLHSQDLLFEDKIFDDKIRTVLFYGSEYELSAPIIQLNTNEKLTLRFDRLSSGNTDYSYTIKHFLESGEASNLNPTEYIVGFESADINDYETSFNTQRYYQHYKVEFPNDEIRPKLSGNYLLIVYEDYDIEKVVLTKRFFVSEESLEISANVKRSTIVSNLESEQEITFTINDKNKVIDSYDKYMNVTVLQNNVPERGLYQLKPDYIKADVYEFYNPRKLRFKGSNEFRYVNTKDYRHTSDRVFNIEIKDKNFFFILYPDDISTKNYFKYSDINGRMVTVVEDIENPFVEAEYVFVDFALRCPEEIPNGDLYVYGEISNYEVNKKNRMTYNYGTKQYEHRMLLKQGFYNYQYVIDNVKNLIKSPSFTEGDFYETENKYFIYVYYYDLHQGYDRLLKVHYVNSISGK